MKEMVGGCCVCSDERGWDENPLVYCDGHGCNVAVHQGKYFVLILPIEHVRGFSCFEQNLHNQTISACTS